MEPSMVTVITNTRIEARAIVAGIRDINAQVGAWHPWVSSEERQREFGIDCFAEEPQPGTYDGVVIAVSHREFVSLGAARIRELCKPRAIIYDVKRHQTDGCL